MSRDIDYTDMSELEREFELQMGGDMQRPERDDKLEEEFEALLESEPPEEAYEHPEEKLDEFADRFYRLSMREFESESDADDSVNKLLGAMEYEYFWGSLKKRLKKLPMKKFKRMLGSLAKKGLKLGIKAGLNAVAPGSGTALSAMGFEVTEDPNDNREAWNNFVAFAREAYEDLASDVGERGDDPLEASRLAANAIQKAMQRSQGKIESSRLQRGSHRGSATSDRQVIRLKPGDEIVLHVERG